MENAEKDLKEEFNSLLAAFFSDNPVNGEELLARLVDVSIPTIRRWRSKSTYPTRVVRRIAIDCLKELSADKKTNKGLKLREIMDPACPSDKVTIEDVKEAVRRMQKEE